MSSLVFLRVMCVLISGRISVFILLTLAGCNDRFYRFSRQSRAVRSFRPLLQVPASLTSVIFLLELPLVEIRLASCDCLHGQMYRGCSVCSPRALHCLMESFAVPGGREDSGRRAGLSGPGEEEEARKRLQRVYPSSSCLRYTQNLKHHQGCFRELLPGCADAMTSPLPMGRAAPRPGEGSVLIPDGQDIPGELPLILPSPRD